MHLHARALLYFDAIRRSGSIREAARHLHIASSAVNRQLLQLEAQIGAPLFERLSTGLRLTAAGELLSRHVISVLQDEQRLHNELDALKGIRRGAIQLATVEGLNASFLPVALERMLTRHPLVKVTVRSLGSEQAARAVIDGDADIAIAFSVARSEALQQFAVGRFALGAIVHPDHPIASLPQVGFAECARHPLILAGPELSIHEQMKPVLAHHKRPLTVLLESGSIELMKRLVARGLAVGFQTRLGIERELAAGELVHVPLKAAVRMTCELGVYARAGRWLPPAIDAFIRLVAEQIELVEQTEAREGR
jgi:DNA-binding transcriptional LysR family regulator